MCVMSVSLLTNTTDSSRSVREERSSPSAAARLLFDWHGEFHYKLVLIIECHPDNIDIAKYLFCRITPEQHRTTLLQDNRLQRKPPRATLVFLLLDDHYGKLLLQT